jgi:hypothetical protein
MPFAKYLAMLCQIWQDNPYFAYILASMAE